MAERSISSPKENVAEKPVVIVQDAQSRIKSIIVEGYYQNATMAEIEGRIAAVIQETVGKMPEALKNSTKFSLASSAQKWHYLYNQSMRTLNASAISSMAGLLQRPSKVTVQNKTYSLNMNDLLSLGANEQKLIIDKFRPYLTTDKSGLAIIEDYDKKVKNQIRYLASDSANFLRVDKNGNTYKPNLRNFAEMITRYEANLEDVKRLKEDGVKLVWTSSHADASPRCSPYQGKLYSLDGSSGTIDGNHYSPLDDALLGPRGDGNGIINGYNCRHRLIEYASKSRAPKEYDKATIKRENDINNRQRQYERDIRNMKIEEQLARKAGDTAYASELRKNWQSLDDKYKSFSLSNERAYYPWRTRITQEEVN